MRFNDTTKENIKKELSTKKGLDDARNLLDGNKEAESARIEARLMELENLAISGLSPKEEAEEAELEKRLNALKGIKDEEPEEENYDERIAAVCRLLGEAHDKVMEALDIIEELENADVVDSYLRYDVEDLESDLSDFDFMGENNPVEHLMEKYKASEEESYDPDDDWDM